MSELRSKLVRIFISSPSDVAEERKAAAELIEDELAKREAFVEKLKLRAFRYDDPNSDTPFLAGHSPQASVDQRVRSADAQIVVAILWAGWAHRCAIRVIPPRFSINLALSRKSRRR
jgi:hypothetical protein